MLHLKSEWFGDFLALFYPKYCYACGKKMVNQEILLCTECELHLPLTDFHTYTPNPMEKMFWGRVEVEAAASYFYFRKGSGVQSLIHHLKYKGKREIGVFFGHRLGLNLSEHPVFSTADAIVPVPLHPKRQRERGYNQSEAVAEGMAEVLHLPVVSDALVRSRATSTQTRRGVYQRWENVSGIFEIRDAASLQGRHLILVDDVTTTGATMEAAARCLQSLPGVKVSLASLAFDML